MLSGNLAPGFAFGKITGKEGTIFRGPARCFDQEEDMMEAVAADAQSLKGCVIVIRYEGPKGGPGMKEMLNPTALVMGATRTRCPRVPPADEASPPRAYQRTALRGQLALVPPVVPHRLHRRATPRAQRCLWPKALLRPLLAHLCALRLSSDRSIVLGFAPCLLSHQPLITKRKMRGLEACV